MACEVVREVSLGEFRRLALEEAKRQLIAARDAEESKAAGGFVKRIPPPLLQVASPEELLREVITTSQDVGTKFPVLAQIAASTAALATECLEVDDAVGLLGAYRRLLQLYGINQDDGDDNFLLTAGVNVIRIGATSVGSDPAGVPTSVVESDRADQGLLAATVNLIAQSRAKARSLTQDERTAVLAAYALLDMGVQVPTSYQGIGVSPDVTEIVADRQAL